MNLIALYYMCSVAIYCKVYLFKKQTTKRSKERNGKTYKNVAPTRKWCEI